MDLYFAQKLPSMDNFKLCGGWEQTTKDGTVRLFRTLLVMGISTFFQYAMRMGVTGTVVKLVRLPYVTVISPSFNMWEIGCRWNIFEACLVAVRHVTVISPPFNMRERMYVPGVVRLAWLLHIMGISPSFNGREIMAATGMSRLVRLLHIMDIFPSFNGREIIAATGMSRIVMLLHSMVISPSSNGRERTGVPGTVRFVRLLHIKATSPSSNGCPLDAQNSSWRRAVWKSLHPPMGEREYP